MNTENTESAGLSSSYGAGFTAACALSMLLCVLFSGKPWHGIPLELGNMPLIALMLYGRLWGGLILGVIHVSLFPLYTDNLTFTGWLTDTGVLIYPLIIGLSGRFIKLNRRNKIRMMTALFAAGQIITLTSALQPGNMDGDHVPSVIGAAVLIITAAALLSSMYVYFVEKTIERVRLTEQITRLSHECAREAGKLQQIMDAAPLNIIIIDHQGSIVSVNDTFLQLYRNEVPSATRDDLIGIRLSGECGGFNIDVIASRVKRTIEHNEKSTELLQFQDKVFFTSTSPITTNGTEEVCGVVIIVQDITELETLRMELNHVERLSLVGQMAAGITHEIRNPMAVVRGFLQLMREKSPNDLDHYYRIVMEELDRANSIINDFLALAQNRIVTKELCSLHRIIEELTPLLWADANLRGQSIEIIMDERVPLLYLNAKEVKQLILNLARNGMEAMGDKGLLMLNTKLESEGVQLFVSDTGSGISAMQREKLFAPFYTTKMKGTGLGLPLCLSIMERHGGKITVHSEEGTGTTFIAVFPLNGSSS